MTTTYELSDEVSPYDRGILHQVFDRFEDLHVVVYRPAPGRYTIWPRKGVIGQLLHSYEPSDGGCNLTEADIEPLTDFGYVAERAIAWAAAVHPELGATNVPEMSLDDMIALRLSDFERRWSPSVVQEKAERGELPGLEFLGPPEPDPLQTVKFDVRPMLHIKDGEVQP